jgi:hypothetical protein
MALDLFSAEVQQVMPLAVGAGTFVSLCTIQKQTGAKLGAGQPDPTAYANVAGLVNIPCMDAVPSTARVQATEVKELTDILSKGLRHVLLNGYYPESTPDGQIPSNWRAIVDGVIYDILGVEHDSQNQQTRLMLQLVTL